MGDSTAPLQNQRTPPPSRVRSWSAHLGNIPRVPCRPPAGHRKFHRDDCRSACSDVRAYASPWQYRCGSGRELPRGALLSPSVGPRRAIHLRELIKAFGLHGWAPSRLRTAVEARRQDGAEAPSSVVQLSDAVCTLRATIIPLQSAAVRCARASRSTSSGETPISAYGIRTSVVMALRRSAKSDHEPMRCRLDQIPAPSAPASRSLSRSGRSVSAVLINNHHAPGWPARSSAATSPVRGGPHRCRWRAGTDRSA